MLTIFNTKTKEGQYWCCITKTVTLYRNKCKNEVVSESKDGFYKVFCEGVVLIRSVTVPLKLNPVRAKVKIVPHLE